MVKKPIKIKRPPSEASAGAIIPGLREVIQSELVVGPLHDLVERLEQAVMHHINTQVPPPETRSTKTNFPENSSIS